MTKNDQFTLEELERDVWPEPEHKSYLLMTCHQLRKKRLSEFDVTDLRIMLGQSIGTEYLLPKAVEILKENPFACGTFFEGDLVAAIARDPQSTLAFVKTNAQVLIVACEAVLGSYEFPLPETDRPNVESLLRQLKDSVPG